MPLWVFALAAIFGALSLWSLWEQDIWWQVMPAPSYRAASLRGQRTLRCWPPLPVFPSTGRLREAARALNRCRFVL